MTIFFTADLHFGHKNIIQYCKRPFASVEEMNVALIRNWNQTVGPEDEVYVLGDLFFCKESEAVSIVHQLNGIIHVVPGNHDEKVVLRSDKVQAALNHDIMPHYVELKLGKDFIVLLHYPILSWNGRYRGSFHLHGHVHAGLQKLNADCRRYDVGVDANDYCPVSWEAIKRKLEKIQVNENPEY